jgi:SAM-dependent methyltransferase
MVFYQPTPVRHILHMIRMCALTAADVLVDLGSGLGHVPILVSLLSQARAVGVEVDSAYVATARECARGIGLNRVQFVRQNALDADLSFATAFYLYTPFTGVMLEEALSRLRQLSARRPIRICTFGPCTQVLAREPWLATDATPEADRIVLFHAHTPSHHKTDH